jgi:hypothetical protein
MLSAAQMSPHLQQQDVPLLVSDGSLTHAQCVADVNVLFTERITWQVGCCSACKNRPLLFLATLLEAAVLAKGIKAAANAKGTNHT